MATDAEARALGFATPQGTDYISGGDDAISQNARVTTDLFNDAKWKKTGIPENTDLSTITEPGYYIVSSAAAASSITPAIPIGYQNIGVIEVLGAASNNYRAYRWTVIGGTRRGTLQIENQAGTWTDWRNTEYDPTPQTLPNGANLNDYVRAAGKYDGQWVSPSYEATATMSGLPAGETALFHLTVLGSTGFQIIQFYQGGLYWRAVSSVSQGAFGPWVRLDQPTAAAGADVATERAVRVSAAKQRIGGRIGTAGVPALALRFDDWSDEMETLVMPELRARNLPAGWAATVAYVETHGSQTWDTVAEWVRDGVELLGHSWTHTNASGDQAIRHEIIDSADYIEQKVPAARIDTWVMPGTSAAANTYDGFGIGNILENFYTKPAGRYIMQRYPVVGGAMPGRFLPLIGEPSIGRSHLTIDTFTNASDVIYEITKAQATGSGFMLMNHPTHLGGDGMLPLDEFRAILDWIAAERDAGRLVVLTPRGIAYADASSSQRLSVVPDATELSDWRATTGYTLSDGYITTTTGGVMQRAFNISNYGALRGTVMEVAAKVRTPAGGVVRTSITGGPDRTVDHTLEASNEWQWINTVATIPGNLPNSTTCAVHVGRVSGGQLDIEHIYARPI